MLTKTSLVLRVSVYFMKVKLRNTVSYEVQLKYKYCNFDRLCVYMLGICWFSPDSLQYNQWEKIWQKQWQRVVYNHKFVKKNISVQNIKTCYSGWQEGSKRTHRGKPWALFHVESIKIEKNSHSDFLSFFPAIMFSWCRYEKWMESCITITTNCN